MTLEKVLFISVIRYNSRDVHKAEGEGGGGGEGGATDPWENSTYSTNSTVILPLHESSVTYVHALNRTEMLTGRGGAQMGYKLRVTTEGTTS